MPSSMNFGAAPVNTRLASGPAQPPQASSLQGAINIAKNNRGSTIMMAAGRDPTRVKPNASRYIVGGWGSNPNKD